MKVQIAFLTILTAFVLNGCKKTDSLDEIPSPLSNVEVGSRDGSLDGEDQRRADFAKVFAKALANPNLRTYLKNKYIQLDQQDKEFVYALYRMDLVSGTTQKLHELLATYADQTFFNQYGADFFNSVINVDPLLTIDFAESDYFSLDTWNVNTVPYVGVATKNLISFGGTLAPGYPGFDSFGNSIRFDDDTQPTTVSL